MGIPGLLAAMALVLPVSWQTPPATETPRITLMGKMSLRKAVEELCAKTGQETTAIALPAGRESETVTVDWNEQTFWQAMQNLAQQTKTVLGTGEQIRLASLEKPAIDAVSLSGPFRITVKKLTSAIDLATGTRQTRAFLEIAWEPRLQPFLLETRPEKQVIRDDGGNTLKPVALGSSVAPVDGRYSIQIDVTLPTPPRQATRYALLEGQFNAVGPGKMGSFRFGKLDTIDSPNATDADRLRRDGDVVCRINRLFLSPERWTFQVAVDTPPGGSRLESFQSWVVNNEMNLVSADGKKKLGSSSYAVESVTDRRAIISYNFIPKKPGDLGKPGDWLMTYTSPLSVITMPIPFTFRDLPLP